MTEIFISYSRRNKAFVEHFLKELNNSGYSPEEIWVDWEDIPASSKWEDEIRKGVEASNSAIFILSPEWAASNECAKELKIAAEYNKRLFPIVCENVDPQTIPPELASLNWIFFREADNFEEAMQKLQAALKTDLEWVSQHTNLLRRANEWEAKGRDRGYLLRGGELQEAETWLSQASENKQPRPTPLQSEYIYAARQDSMKRQRRTLIGVSVALVGSLILAIVAMYSGEEALRQSQRALASQLAAESSGLINTQPDLSMLLSLEANYIGDQLGETYSSWTGSLITSLNSSPKLSIYLRANTADAKTVRAVAFSPDGHWLASTGDAAGGVGQVLLWDMSSTTQLKPYQKFTGGTQRFLGVAFSADSQRLVAAGDEGKLFVWDPQKCCDPIAEWPVNNKVRALSFAQVNGHEYAAIGAGHEVTFWDIATGRQDASLTLQIPVEDPSVRLLSLAVSPDNSAIAAGSDDGNVTVWDLKTHEQRFHACSFDDPTSNDSSTCVASGEGLTDIRGVAFTPDGKLLITGSSDRRAWLWDAHSGVSLAKSPAGNEGGHLNTISSVAVNPKDGTVATVSWDNTVRTWKLINDQFWSFQRVNTLAGHSNSIWTAAFSPGGQVLATGSSDTTVILWKLNQTSQIGFRFAQMSGDVWGVATSSDGKQLAAGDAAGNIHIWNFDGHTLTRAATLQHPGGVLTVAFSHDNKWLASAGYDKTIRVWDVQTGKVAWQIDNAHTDQIWQVAFSPDDKLLASVSFDKTAKLWDTSTHQQVGKSMEHGKSVYALAFNQDGTKLLVAGYESDIYVWDISNPAAIPDPVLLSGHQAAVNLLAFNPVHPSIFASTSDDKTLLVWNLDLKQHTPPILGLNESMEAVTFRPDGNWLASATNNRTVLLWQWDGERCSQKWDQVTCQPSRLGTPLVGHSAPVENVVFLSNTTLVSSSENGQLILWNLDKQDWYERACTVVNRSLSDSEFSQYVEGQLSKGVLQVVAWVKDMIGGRIPEPPPSCIRI